MNQKVALITGASSGIGAALAAELVRLGYRTYAASRSMTADLVPGVIPVSLDVTDPAAVSAAVQEILTASHRLDLLVNCAGYGIAGAVEDTSIAEAKAQFETNFFGTMQVCAAVLPTMRAQKSGTIINISSLTALTSIPFQGLYSASKAALGSLTEAMRMEVARFGIKVVLIEPGDYATGFTAQRVLTAGSHTNSAYQEKCANSIAQMAKDEQNGPSPEKITKLLRKILATRNPKLRYKTGRLDQTLGVAIKPLLPQKLYEKILMKIYQL